MGSAVLTQGTVGLPRRVKTSPAFDADCSKRVAGVQSFWVVRFVPRPFQIWPAPYIGSVAKDDRASAVLTTRGRQVATATTAGISDIKLPTPRAHNDERQYVPETADPPAAYAGSRTGRVTAFFLAANRAELSSLGLGGSIYRNRERAANGPRRVFWG